MPVSVAAGGQGKGPSMFEQLAKAYITAQTGIPMPSDQPAQSQGGLSTGSMSGQVQNQATAQNEPTMFDKLLETLQPVAQDQLRYQYQR